MSNRPFRVVDAKDKVEPKEVEETMNRELRRQLAGPICPHCSAEPLYLAFMAIDVPPEPPMILTPMRGMVCFCANPECRKTITVQILHIEKPKIQTDPRLMV